MWMCNVSQRCTVATCDSVSVAIVHSYKFHYSYYASYIHVYSYLIILIWSYYAHIEDVIFSITAKHVRNFNDDVYKEENYL